MVNVYNMFQFHPQGLQDGEEEDDIVRAIPTSKQLPHGHFDTVVAIVQDTAESTGVKGMFNYRFEHSITLRCCTRHQDWKGSCHLHPSK